MTKEYMEPGADHLRKMCKLWAVEKVCQIMKCEGIPVTKEQARNIGRDMERMAR